MPRMARQSPDLRQGAVEGKASQLHVTLQRVGAGGSETWAQWVGVTTW